MVTEYKQIEPPPGFGKSSFGDPSSESALAIHGRGFGSPKTKWAGELILNGDFENWADINNTPDDWSNNLVTSVRDSDFFDNEISTGIFSAKSAGGATAGFLTQTLETDRYNNMSIKLQCYVKVSGGANDASIYISTPAGILEQVYHTGGGDWELLTVTRTIPEDAVQVSFVLAVAAGATALYDHASAIVKG